MNNEELVGTTTSNPRGGVDIHFDLESSVALQRSPTWQVAGRTLCFVRLAPGADLSLDPGTHYLKVVTGYLQNIDLGCYAAAFAVRSTQVSESRLIAGPEGALFALLTETEEVPEKITAMEQVQFAGHHADCLTWQSFEEKYGAFIDLFAGLDCHLMNGIHLLDTAGDEIVYVNFWTCGKGVDLSTHNHAQDPGEHSPAFAEIHWVIDAGTDTSGMYRTEAPGHPERIRQYLQRGEEHGPYFSFDDAGRPVRRDNGAVEYGWHGWQGGTDDGSTQAYDFVAAFEINPEYAVLER